MATRKNSRKRLATSGPDAATTAGTGTSPTPGTATAARSILVTPPSPSMPRIVSRPLGEISPFSSRKQRVEASRSWPAGLDQVPASGWCGGQETDGRPRVLLDGLPLELDLVGSVPGHPFIPRGPLSPPLTRHSFLSSHRGSARSTRWSFRHGSEWPSRSESSWKGNEHCCVSIDAVQSTDSTCEAQL